MAEIRGLTVRLTGGIDGKGGGSGSVAILQYSFNEPRSKPVFELFLSSCFL